MLRKTSCLVRDLPSLLARPDRRMGVSLPYSRPVDLSSIRTHNDERARSTSRLHDDAEEEDDIRHMKMLQGR